MGKWDQAMVARAVAALDAGMSQVQTAAELGVHPQGLSDHVNQGRRGDPRFASLADAADRARVRGSIRGGRAPAPSVRATVARPKGHTARGLPKAGERPRGPTDARPTVAADVAESMILAGAEAAMARFLEATADKRWPRFPSPPRYKELRQFFHGMSDETRRAAVLMILGEEARRIETDRGADITGRTG